METDIFEANKIVRLPPPFNFASPLYSKFLSPFIIDSKISSSSNITFISSKWN